MTVKTRKEYIKSLKELKPNIYKFGKLIKDVTTNPATKRVVESHARLYEAAALPKYKDIFETKSHLTGKEIFRWNSLVESEKELIAETVMKRVNYHITGTCTGGVCVGWEAMNVMWAITYDIDKDLGTSYHQRLKKWILSAQDKGITIAGALTDAKGNRTLKASQQQNLDSNLRIVKVEEDGIIIRGAKVMIAGVAASNEIFILSGNKYGESDKDFAVSCVVPRDIKGLMIIEATHPNDLREHEEGFFVPDTGITQAYLYFDDVFVPNERVFMCKEYQYTGTEISSFTDNYRSCIGACVSGQGDVMIGAAVLVARANGIPSKAFKNEIIEMAINNETTYGMGIGAIALGKQHPSGAYFSDSLLAHVNKTLVATLPYETKRICQDIGGGIVETGCFPSFEDFTDHKLGPIIQKNFKAGDASAKTRAKAARLVEWLTLGAGVPGTMHGGGSPGGARMVVKSKIPIEEYVNYARDIMNIKEDVPEPKKVR